MADLITIKGNTMQIDLSKPIDISIPLHFNGPQPNAFDVDAATSSVLGDTRDGASVNFEQYTFIPHCNGTHTECVGHITDERISVRDCLQDVMVVALLMTVEPENVDGEMLITADLLRAAVASGTLALQSALIVRTLPNDDGKLTRQYDGEVMPPYFTAEAMEYIVECGFKHLLVDTPSIDRIFDDGKLTNHRVFWDVKPGSCKINAATRVNSTITELIFVPNEVIDGEYLLNLQIAPFVSDAAPSRPVIFKKN